jgi:pimeloyl-ACP methyl ester carboxylesterase
MCSGVFVVEDIESRQADVRDFFLTESNYRCRVRVAGDPKAVARIASYYRAAASPGAAAAIMRMNREIDVRHVLPATRVPTLILHRTGDHVIDVKHARYMAQHICPPVSH